MYNKSISSDLLRIAYCVLRIAYCVLRIAYCVLRMEFCYLHIRCYVGILEATIPNKPLCGIPRL